MSDAPQTIQNTAPTARQNLPSPKPHRRLLAAATLGAIALLLSATAGFLWLERARVLNESAELAARGANRLATDLQQSLTVALTAIDQFNEQLQQASSQPFQTPAASLAGSQAELLAALPLPFRLHAIGPQDREILLIGNVAQLATKQTHVPRMAANTTPGRWGVGNTVGLPQQAVIPLVWRAEPNAQGISSYGVDLGFDKLQRWLESERRNPEDRISLFRMNGDGTATLLARAPRVDAQLGTAVTTGWVASAELASVGVVDVVSQFDGVARRVAYQRLSGPADSLVLVYGACSNTALALWSARLPYLVGLALLLAAAMGWGGWRLDRSFRAQAQSELRYRLAATTGQVWDWNLLTNELRLPPSIWSSLNREAPPPERAVAVFESLIAPEDRANMQVAFVRHIRQREPYRVTLRLNDDQDRGRWFESQGQAVWDSNGQATYMAGTVFEITERQVLEEDQRQTLARLDTVANASAVLFWTCDVQGQTDWVNRRWLAFTGRSLAEELGEGWKAGIHPDDRKRCEASFQNATNGLEPYSMEFQLRHVSGDYRWVLDQGIPRHDADGNYIGYIGSCVDLTVIKTAERVATQQRQLLDRLFDVLPDLFFLMESDSTILDYRGAEGLYMPPAQFLGKRMSDVLPSALSVQFRHKFEEAQSGKLAYWEYDLPSPDGQRKYEARLARLTDSTQLMAIVRDITDEIQLEHERERLNRFVVLLFRLSSRFINLPLERLDAEIDHALAEIGAFVGVDRAYVFSYDLAHGVARNTHEWCAPGIESVKHLLQALPIEEMLEWEWHRSGQPFSVSDTRTLEAGPTRSMLEAQDIQSMLTLPMNAAEVCLGFVGFDSIRSLRSQTKEDLSLLHLFAQMLVNVTERRAAQAKLLELTVQLEQRVAERTQQLDHSIRRLSQANRELESFAYSVSHDLKSPLRSVEGFASLLLDEQANALNDDARDYLKRIQRATLHMARLINDLLAYCRIEELGSRLVPLRLSNAVEEVLQGMHNELEAKQTTVRINLPPTLVAMAHPQGLAMVLRNLVDNALKFTRPGERPEISIEACVIGPVVRLSVRDHGMGFDMKHHDRIFAIFQRLHRPDQIAGTGIGLAMVFKAVERMEGRIWAQSTPGEGATFHIELPRA
jgi:PAS domain S-box-containing protein